MFVVNNGVGGGATGAVGAPGKHKGKGRSVLGRPGKAGAAAILAAIGFDLFGPTDTDSDDGKTGAGGLAANTLSGAAVGSLGGPFGVAGGSFVGFSKWLTDETNVPNSELPVAQYEKMLAEQENFAEQFGGKSTGFIADLGKQLAEIADTKVDPEFEVLGVDEAEQVMQAFRERAGATIEIPVVAKFNAALAELFDFGAGDDVDPNIPRGRGRGRGNRGGINVNIDKMVAQDYRDMQRQLQHHAQQNSVGGIGVLAS